MDRIIVAFDGSADARLAFAYALMIASDAAVEVVGFYAIEPSISPAAIGDPTLGFDAGPVVAFDAQRVEEERADAEKAMRGLKAEATERGVRFDSKIVSGRLLDALPDEAAAADLVCVGRKGRFARAGIGSSTKALTNDSPCPVMVVSGEMRPLTRVLGVYDSSAASKKAVAFAQGFAKQTGWPLAVLAAAGHGKTLGEALERAQAQAPDADVISLSEDEQGDVGRVVEHAAHKAGFSLIVMGAYPDSWLHRLFFGGTTEHVLAKVPGPIVLVH